MSSVSLTGANAHLIELGQIRAKYSARGDRVLSYYIDIAHKALHIHKQVSAAELSILERKAQILLSEWEAKYAVLTAKKNMSAGREMADRLGVEAETRRQYLKATLKATLTVNDRVNWSKLEINETFEATPFSTPQPREPEPLRRPVAQEATFWDKLFGRRSRIETENKAQEALYQERLAKQSKQYNEAFAKWSTDKADWLQAEADKQKQHDSLREAENAKVAELKKAWLGGEAAAVTEHADLVLEASQHDPIVPKDYSIFYDSDQRLMVLDYRLPSPDDIPTIKSVKFVTSTGELKESHIAQKEASALFDEICYQICLRTVHELFEADEPHNIESIVFNGTCEASDRATGQMKRATILSLRVARDDFLRINLGSVDARDCFKGLKGVAASTLSGLTPIPPLVAVDRTDHRFIEGRSVDLGRDGGVNLAAMSWDDFEHLVRELFEKEFAARGGEVRVTQASSDGGVDAIAFDPDPISGGKIVIQAKRYTKTVGVAAVRDLYGTVMNEGANKGILVTTSDFGPDAHKFAAGKPLTLMGGSNLLYLLEKHGQKARIDVADARKELGLR